MIGFKSDYVVHIQLSDHISNEIETFALLEHVLTSECMLEVLEHHW